MEQQLDLFEENNDYIVRKNKKKYFTFAQS